MGVGERHEQTPDALDHERVRVRTLGAVPRPDAALLAAAGFALGVDQLIG